jgi:hypothetical protein
MRAAQPQPIQAVHGWDEKGRPVGEARRPWGFAPGGVSGAVPMALVSRAGMRPFGRTYMGSLPRRAVCQVAASGRDQTSVSSLIPAHRSSSATMSIAMAPSSLRPPPSLGWRALYLSGRRACIAVTLYAAGSRPRTWSRVIYPARHRARLGWRALGAAGIRSG